MMRGSDLEKSRVSMMCKGYASGGAVKPFKAPGTAMKADIKRVGPMKKAIGAMEGEAPKPRLDRFNRGGAVRKGGAKTNVNVIVAPQAPADKPMPVMPPIMPPPVAVAPPPRPPMAAAPPQLGPPGAMPPGLGPRPFKRGGAVKNPKMTDGAGSGLGRLEKIAVQKRKG